MSSFNTCFIYFFILQKAETLKEPSTNSNTVEPNQPQVFWYVIVVAVIGKISEEQATNVNISTTTNPDGSVTQTAIYNCTGVGSYHISMSVIDQI